MLLYKIIHFFKRISLINFSNETYEFFFFKQVNIVRLMYIIILYCV